MREGYKDTPIGMIPEDWEQAKLGSICKVKRGASPRPIDDPIWWGGTVGWVRISDVTSTKKYLRKTVQYLSSEGVAKSVRIPKGEVIVSICATIGKPIIMQMDACIHDGFVWFDDLGENVDREFLYYFFLSNQQKLASNRQTGTQGNLNTTIVGELPISLPPLLEQSKIASVLSTVDEKIDSINERITQTQQLKNGLMQRLFTRGIGHTKFKDSPLGEIPEIWEVVSLKDTGEIISGGTPDTTKQEFWNGHHAWCTPTDITSLNGKRFIKTTSRYISEEGLKNSSATLLPKYSLVICTRATIGDCAINEVPITTNQGFKSIIPNKNWDVKFLYYLIIAKKNVLIKLSSGSTFLEISKSAFEKIPIPKPHIAEQNKISEILFTIDDELESLKDKKAEYEKLKKGLMQQLLTGKIRVNV